MSIRIAAVSFLNTVPLIDALVTDGPRGITLIKDLPSRLASYLHGGSADVALLPVAEIFRGGTGGVLPVGGIGCQGAVDSVKLYTSGALDSIGTVLADRGSRSSVALLRILLIERYGIEPQIIELEPRIGTLPQSGEGILIIGDRCFEYERYLRESGYEQIQRWDLGLMWWEMTKLPFVFAVWAVAPDLDGRIGHAGVEELGVLLASALSQGVARLEQIAAREANSGRLGHEGCATASAIEYYLRQSLCFTVGDMELRGMRRFHQLAVKHGLVPVGPFPQIL